jgi:tetratricopeptide (TPR) repeat protein
MPTLELSMIVKNGSRGLARCLKSVQPIVDRITIGDTGSTDNSPAIARAHRATVLPLPWNDDFAAARNAVLAHAACDWILVLDADEMLDQPGANAILELISKPPANGSGATDAIHAFDMVRHNYVHDTTFRCVGKAAIRNHGPLAASAAYPAFFESTHTRLFRRDPRIRFEHRVHETVADRLDHLRLTRHPCSVLIHHFGYVEDPSPARLEKSALYHRLSLAKAQELPRDYHAQLEAGLSEFDHARNPQAALPYLEAACALRPHAPAPWLYRGLCCTRSHHFDQALHHLTRAAVLDPNNPLAHSALGDLFAQQQNHAGACAAYRKAQSLGDCSALSAAKLGAAEVQLGHRATGIARIQAAIAQGETRASGAAIETQSREDAHSPHAGSGELYSILAAAALLADDLPTAAAAAEHRLQSASATPLDFLIAATIAQQAGHSPHAEATLQAGLARFPANPEIQKMLSAATL